MKTKLAAAHQTATRKSRMRTSFYGRVVAALIVVAAIQSSFSQSPPILSLQLNDGNVRLSVSGDLGSPCTVQYATNLSPPVQWLVLTNIALCSSPTFFTNPAAAAPERFYRVVIATLTNEFGIFSRIASNSVASNRFTFTGGTFTGTNSWSPSADGTYNEFVPRDAINAVRATPWLFSATDIRNLCKQTDSLYNKNGVNDIGIAITVNGTAPTSVLQFDHSFDFISLLYQSWLKEGQGTPVMWNAYSIDASNTFASVTVTNHLLYLNAAGGINGTGWGFTESIFVTGYHVMGSLFRYRACAEMHLLTTAAGQPTTFYTNEMRLIAAQLKTRAYDSTVHLYRLGTVNGLDEALPWNMHDIIGSALAVDLGACDVSDARDISYALAGLVDAGAFDHGAVKYFPNSEAPTFYDFFEAANGVRGDGTYQCGGYWPEFTSWCAEAIRRVRPDLSDKLMTDLASRYSTLTDAVVPYEWMNGGIETIPGESVAAKYLDSATMPLEYWTRPLYQLSTNFSTFNAGLTVNQSRLQTKMK